MNKGGREQNQLIMAKCWSRGLGMWKCQGRGLGFGMGKAKPVYACALGLQRNVGSDICVVLLSVFGIGMDFKVKPSHFRMMVLMLTWVL